jgi:hypothetical protein
MKLIYNFPTIIRSITAIAFLVACSQFMSCGSGGGDDPEPEKTAAELTTAKLTASPWKVGTVTVDGTDQSSLFKNFTITFTSSGFTTANGGVVWPASSNWSFTDANATSFSRGGDGVTVQLQEITDSSLKMSLAWSKNTLGPGRIESVKGQHVFTMGK